MISGKPRFGWKELKKSFEKFENIDVSNVPNKFYKDVIDKKATIIITAYKNGFWKRLLTKEKFGEPVIEFKYIVKLI